MADEQLFEDLPEQERPRAEVRGAVRVGGTNPPRHPRVPASHPARRTATSEIVLTAILRGAVLRTAPQDEVRGIKFHPFR
jgi:hypothetical protein